MIKTFTYPNIENTTYQTAGFYHKLGNLNACVNVGVECPQGNDSFTLQLSFDDKTWFNSHFFDNVQNTDTKFISLGKDYQGIVAIRLKPASHQTYTMTVCEYACPL